MKRSIGYLLVSLSLGVFVLLLQLNSRGSIEQTLTLDSSEVGESEGVDAQGTVVKVIVSATPSFDSQLPKPKSTPKPRPTQVKRYEEILLPAIGDAKSGKLRLKTIIPLDERLIVDENFLQKLKEAEQHKPEANTIRSLPFSEKAPAAHIDSLLTCSPREHRIIYGDEKGIFKGYLSCTRPHEDSFEFNGWAYGNSSTLARFCPPYDDPEEQFAVACTLIVSDGSAENTVIPRFNGETWLTELGDAVIFKEDLYFRANVRLVRRGYLEDSLKQCGIWRSKGNPESIRSILTMDRCIISSSSRRYDRLDVATDGKRLFILTNKSLYQSDGTEHGLQLLYDAFYRDFGAPIDSGDVWDITVANNKIYLILDDEVLVYYIDSSN